jgi:hypothetical protein
MTQRTFTILTAVCGILSFLVLTTSFAINQGPPAGATVEQVLVWGRANAMSVLVGGWMQGIGAVLNVIFILALVRLASAERSFAGILTTYAATIVTAISLVEIAGYISAVLSGQNNDLGSLAMSLILIKSVQHLYFISLPVMLPLGFVVLQSCALPRVFGYLGIAIGGIFFAVGVALIFMSSDIILFVVPSLFSLWVLAAAITLLVRRDVTPRNPAVD